MRTKYSIMAAVALLAACADNDMVQLTPEEPSSLETYDYLKGYDALKTYADCKIGVNVGAATFLDDNIEYRIAASNFNELVPETTFSHGATVKASGAVDSSKIISVTERAKAQGMAVFGMPLVSYQNQNSTYLNSRIEPNVIRPDGDEGGYAIKMTNTIEMDAANEAQVAYTFARTPSVEPSIKYKLTFMVRGTAEGKVQCATYSNGRGSRFLPDFNVTTTWTKVSMTNSMASGITGLQSILFNVGKYIGTLYVDDIELYELDDWDEEATDNLNTLNANLDDAETTAASVSIHTNNDGLEDVGVSALGEGYDPLATYVDKTAEEKRTILTADMEKYISKVMTANDGTVTEWGVVCDPLDGTELRTGESKTLGGGEFYWADYLGKDYATVAFKTAAKYAGDGKLYLCESGMENDAAKCDALLEYADYIESNGGRIDGIGASVEVSTSTANRDLIAQMFGKLAATGKMVKITNLQVSVDNAVATDSVSEQQLQEQGELYNYIVKSYLQQVPAQQRGGIVQAAVLDGDTPIGLWSRTYDRKHAYGGFVKGLLEE